MTYDLKKMNETKTRSEHSPLRQLRSGVNYGGGGGVNVFRLIIMVAITSCLSLKALNEGYDLATVMGSIVFVLCIPQIILIFLFLFSIVAGSTIWIATFLIEFTSYALNLLFGYPIFIFAPERAY